MLILIDTNVPMYSWGRDHDLRIACLEILRLVEKRPSAFITDAEVLQELVHRYKAIQTWSVMRERFEDFVDMILSRTEPVFAEDVIHAAHLVDHYPALSARDLIHVAIAVRAGATHIVSADAAFDALEEIERLDPAHVAEWRERVVSG